MPSTFLPCTFPSYRITAIKLFHSSLSTHHPCHLRNAVNGKGRHCQRLHGNGHEFHGIVIGRHAVGAEASAHPATVNDRPLSVFPHPDCHRIHITAAVGLPVSRLHIHMQAGQAVRTVIPVPASGTLRHYQPTAYLTGKCFITCVVFVVSFFKGSSLIFSVQSFFLLFQYRLCTTAPRYREEIFICKKRSWIFLPGAFVSRLFSLIQLPFTAICTVSALQRPRLFSYRFICCF